MILFSYIIYLGLSAIITLYVGYLCYAHGAVYLHHMLDDSTAVSVINKALLLGYYLINLGAIALSIMSWPATLSLAEMINLIAFRCGGVILLLGMMHYINLTVLIWYSQQQKKSISCT